MPTVADHAFVLLLVVTYPMFAVVAHARFRWELGQKEPGARERQYHRGSKSEWLLTGGMLAIWIGHARPLADLGLLMPAGWRLWTTLLLAGALLLHSAIQIAQGSGRGSAVAARLHELLQPVLRFLPQSQAELNAFALLAVTAGTCEELLFRGYLIWYVGAYVSLTWALLLSSALFGLAHIYQGRQGALRTGAYGLGLGGLFVLTGSLLAPMLVHVMLDLRDGVVAWVVRHLPVRERRAGA